MANSIPAFKLRFPEAALARWASRYPVEADAGIEEGIAPRARARGCLTKRDLLALAAWKSPRSQPLVRANPPEVVEAVTAAALASSVESVKVNVLRSLRGIAWPTASVILHFCDARPYPVLDVLALWSLGCTRPPPYTLDLWLAYTAFTRGIAERSGQSMRTVDRALWQYAKAHSSGR